VWLSIPSGAEKSRCQICHTTYFELPGSIQSIVPLGITVLLPLIVKSYLSTDTHHSRITKSTTSLVLFIGLLLNTLFWILKSANNGHWFEALPERALKAWRIRIAQLVLVVCFPVGVSAFIWGSALDSSTEDPTILDSNQHTVKKYRLEARYFDLLAAFVLPALLVQEPFGAGSLAILTWQILALAEILHANSLQDHSIGPVILGILGSFHFFRTGHQATSSSIQWRSAFIPFYEIRYPWSPLLVILNTFRAQILATIAVPLIPLWRRAERAEAANLSWKIYGAVAVHLLYYGAINLGTTFWAGLLRRHLMLYRVFCPRFMMGAVVLLIVDLVSVVITLNGAHLGVVGGTVWSPRTGYEHPREWKEGWGKERSADISSATAWRRFSIEINNLKTAWIFSSKFSFIFMYVRYDLDILL
jgi:GPI ethanolamine phosphate transferase 3 subunit O